LSILSLRLDLRPRSARLPDMPFSNAAEDLLISIGRRGAHVSDVCSQARAIRKDGFRHPVIDAIASSGDYGNHRTNEERDLHRWLQDLVPSARKYFLRCLLEIGDEKGVTESVLIPVLLPWELMFGLGSYGELQFQAAFLSEDGKDFNKGIWQWAKTQDFGKAHPVLQRADADNDFLELLLAIVLHMDGAEMFNSSEHYIFSWQALGACGAVWDKKMLVACVPHKRMRDKAVKQAVFAEFGKFFKWVFDVLETGCFPSKGMYEEELDTERLSRAGKEFANGWKGAFFGMKHDAKARRELHNFRRHYSSTFVCDECLATQPFKNAPRDVLYADFTEDALHARTFCSHEWYMAHETNISPFAQIRGWHKDMLFRDILHDIWLGTARDDVAASITDMLEADELPGTDTTNKLNTLWGACKVYCQNNKLSKPRGGFSVGQIGRYSKKKVPELSSKFKAMQVKVICKFLADYTFRLDDGSSKHKGMRSMVFWALTNMIHIFDVAKRAGRPLLNADEIAEAAYSGRTYLLCYQWLSVESLTLQTHNFRMRPKRHFVDHMVRKLHWGLNPGEVTCDDDETFMGVVKRFGSSTHGLSAMRRILDRYLVGLGMRIRERARLHQLFLSRAV
jgi:hypothetical protein